MGRPTHLGRQARPGRRACLGCPSLQVRLDRWAHPSRLAHFGS